MHNDIRLKIQTRLGNDQRHADKLEGARLAYETVLKWLDEEEAERVKDLDDYFAASLECDADHPAPEVPPAAEPEACGCEPPVPDVCPNPRLDCLDIEG